MLIEITRFYKDGSPSTIVDHVDDLDEAKQLCTDSGKTRITEGGQTYAPGEWFDGFYIMETGEDDDCHSSV